MKYSNKEEICEDILELFKKKETDDLIYVVDRAFKKGFEETLSSSGNKELKKALEKLHKDNPRDYLDILAEVIAKVCKSWLGYYHKEG